MKWEVMNKRMLLAMILGLLCFSYGNAQIRLDKVAKSVKNKTERKIERRIEHKIDKAVDKGLNNAEEAIDQAASPEKKTTDQTASENKRTTAESGAKAPENSGTEVSQPQQLGIRVWASYDFIPGPEILFEDDQKNEVNGEFPSKWDLVRGNIENASVDGENVIYFMKVNANGGGGIVPLIEHSDKDYLPDEFTVEFDAWFPNQYLIYYLFFADYKNQKNIYRTGNNSEEYSAEQYLRFRQNSANGKNIETRYLNGADQSVNTPCWRHIAVSFNKRALKAYLDQERILNIPNVRFNPTGIGISSHNTDGKTPGYIKNIRLAKGAVPLYDKWLTEGRFSTTGIKFDVNKSTLKNESMGTIIYVAEMMKKHSELSFVIEGHTDSDGQDDFNQLLSEQRANTVKNTLVELGIDANRLTCAGYGESRPVSDNTSSEGKAANRRVEFVKQ